MISTKGRYALRMMIDLALNEKGDVVPLREIAARQDISIKYLEQIVSILTRGGMVKSVRGVGGGYSLTRKPEEYTVGQILRLTEGSLAPVACVEGEENTCPKVRGCTTIKVWEKLYGAINNVLDNITLEDLVFEHRSIPEGGYTYCI